MLAVDRQLNPEARLVAHAVADANQLAIDLDRIDWRHAERRERRRHKTPSSASCW
jgi:hypothetical protein